MNNLDFLPERIRKQRSGRRRLVRQAYLLALCAASLVVLGYIRQGQVATARADVALLEECVTNLQQQTARREVLADQLQELAIKKQVEEHLGSRITAQLVLAELHHQMPPSTFLTSLELETMEIQVGRKAAANVSARATVAGTGDHKTDSVKRMRLTLVGMAPSDVEVANFIGQLSASPLFEDVTMGYTKNVTYKGRTAREFRASCYVVR
jgi:Tfp pilus assembly protein PilN